MNTLQATIFTDETAEFTNIQAPSPSIDLTDWFLPNSLIGTFTSNPNFLITAANGQVGYFEIEFHLDNSFWGCNFSFGNSACGIQIRQAISHLIDKNSFVANEAYIAGHATSIDNPVPTTSGGGLLSPTPCGYDASFPESGSQCVVGTNGGVAYHLQSSGTGANGIPWIYPPGSQDLDAAAQHFVNAGLAAGFNSTTSVLKGISPAVTSNPPSFFVRSDNVPRLDMGNSLGEEICWLFTGSYAACPTILRINPGEISTSFPGFVTSGTSVRLLWNMYTAAFSGPTFFDGSLYRTYNSRFISGISSIQQPAGPCDPNSVPTEDAANYVYACDPTYDNLSSQMEFAPCVTAPGDPVIGATSNLPTSPGNGLCTGTTQLSAISAGIQALAEFGSKALTLPIFEMTVQYGYLNNGWTRVDNGNAIFGLANYFTWLDAWNPAPVVPQTIRQGFRESVLNANPFLARTPWDLYVMGNVYNSLFAQNPEYPSQFINWMTISEFQQCAGVGQCTSTTLGYTPPPNTLATYRFTLRPDLYFQDGRQVTSYDVAFSYLSMVGSGASLSSGASSMTGITILRPQQFDISVSSLGIFTLPNLTGIPVVPGRYWTNAGNSTWDTAVGCVNSGSCGESQYTLSGSAPICDTTRNPAFNCTTFPASLMSINQADITATFDPIANHIYIGSGPWTCGTVTARGSGTCTSTGTMNVPPGGTWTLTRFGAGVSIVTQSNEYFRSSTNAALWIWSQQGGANSFPEFSVLAHCYAQPVSLTGPCGHWQQGIGNPGTGNVVGVSQVAIGNRFFNLNWVNGGPPSQPYDWATNPPGAIGLLPPVLYEGPVTLSPAFLVGCPSGYDC
jgi:ABC-type transport system substrate-binding protein